MIRNPIIHKEVLSALRTKKAALMQIMFLVTTSALVLWQWPSEGMQDVGGQQARAIFGQLAIGELILVMLFAPAFTAASLTSEHEHNTFESLFATALRPWEIAVGKMVGSLTFLLLVVLTGIPALAVPLLLGGIAGTDVLAVVGVLLLTAVYLGMIGLLVSSMMHRSSRAIIVTYAALLVICFLLAAPAWPISGNMMTRGTLVWQDTLHVLASLSPLEAMMSLVWGMGGPYSTGASNMPAFWKLFLPLSAGVTGIIAMICLYKLHRPIAPPRPREKLKVVERGQISARTFLFLVDPRKRKRMVQWWQNATLVKEFRTRPMLQAQWLLRTGSICLIISVLLMFLVSLSVKTFVQGNPNLNVDMMTAVGALMVAVLLLVGPAITSGALCADRETGVWDLIRMTPLPSWRIASGKFQASMIPLLLLAVSMSGALAILLVFDLKLWVNILRVLSVVGVTTLFVATAGMFFSSICSKTSTSTAWTYAVVVTVGMLTLLVLLAEDRFSDRLMRGIFLANPIAAAMDAAGHTGMQRFNLYIDHLKIMGVTTAALFVVTVVRVFQLRGRD